MVSKRILIASSIAIICMVQFVACRPGDDDEEDSKPAATAAAAATIPADTKVSPKPPLTLKPKIRDFAILPASGTLKDKKIKEAVDEDEDEEEEQEEEEEEEKKKLKPKEHNYFIRKLIALPKFFCSPIVSMWHMVKKGARHLGLFKKKNTEKED